MIIASNITPKEEYRLTGTITGDRLRLVMDTFHFAENVTNVDAYIEEGRSQFPAEDFLAKVISELGDFSKKLRGDNRQQLAKIVEKLEEIASNTNSASEYGREELDKALKAIKSKS